MLCRLIVELKLTILFIQGLIKWLVLAYYMLLNPKKFLGFCFKYKFSKLIWGFSWHLKKGKANHQSLDFLLLYSVVGDSDGIITILFVFIRFDGTPC